MGINLAQVVAGEWVLSGCPAAGPGRSAALAVLPPSGVQVNQSPLALDQGPRPEYGPFTLAVLEVFRQGIFTTDEVVARLAPCTIRKVRESIQALLKNRRIRRVTQRSPGAHATYTAVPA